MPQDNAVIVIQVSLIGAIGAILLYKVYNFVLGFESVEERFPGLVDTLYNTSISSIELAGLIGVLVIVSIIIATIADAQ